MENICEYLNDDDIGELDVGNSKYGAELVDRGQQHHHHHRPTAGPIFGEPSQPTTRPHNQGHRRPMIGRWWGVWGVVEGFAYQ